MELDVIGDRLLVRKFSEAVSSGGIVYVKELVDDGLVKELVEGEVLKVGPGEKLKTGGRGSMWDLKKGQVVKFSPVCSFPVPGEPDLVIIRRDAVAGVVV